MASDIFEKEYKSWICRSREIIKWINKLLCMQLIQIQSLIFYIVPKSHQEWVQSQEQHPVTPTKIQRKRKEKSNYVNVFLSCTSSKSSIFPARSRTGFINLLFSLVSVSLESRSRSLMKSRKFCFTHGVFPMPVLSPMSKMIFVERKECAD